MLFAKTGEAVALLKQLKKAKALRRVRFTARGRGECSTLVLGIGQVHPVLSGRFARYQARRIANVQTEIFEICRFLHQKYGVESFGQEGFSGRGKARLPQAFLQEMKKARGHTLEKKSTMKSAAAKWRKALHRGDATEANKYATMLNALTVLQALEPGVSVYPIEQADVHGAIGQTMDRLRKEIASVETTSAYQSAVAKGGKGLTKEEYEAMKQRNQLIKEFNRVIAHPERDRAILRQVLKHVDGPITVFVLGAGHRSGMLSLAAKHIPKGTLFVWAEPPRLWWWKATINRIFWSIIAILSLFMLLSLR